MFQAMLEYFDASEPMFGADREEMIAERRNDISLMRLQR
jgi:hypothetical protein